MAKRPKRVPRAERKIESLKKQLWKALEIAYDESAKAKPNWRRAYGYLRVVIAVMGELRTKSD